LQENVTDKKRSCGFHVADGTPAFKVDNATMGVETMRTKRLRPAIPAESTTGLGTMRGTERDPKCIISHFQLVFSAPMRIDSVPTVSSERVIALRTNTGTVSRLT
jgi:hypothetical protein